MIRVLEIFGEPVSNGGQESFLFNVLKNMDLSNITVDVFTPYYCDNNYYERVLEELKGKLIHLDLPFEPGKSRRNIYNPICQYLTENHYDVIHIHSGSTSVLALAALAAKRSGVRKIIVHSHCTGIRKNLKYWVTKRAMMPLLDLCPTDYCACSKEAGEWRFSRRAMSQLVILKNGVDLERFRYSPEVRQLMRNHLGIDDKDFVIGHVGRFSYQKNQEFIIELLNKLKTDIPNIKAILIGTGETEKEIRKQSRINDLEDKVLFIGNVNNVEDYLQAMDVFVFPSRFEGLGIVGVEAQANGMPVLASTNIPQEMKVSPLVQYINLSDMRLWIDTIMRLQNEDRNDVTEQIRNAGYDVHETANALKHLYSRQIAKG